VDVLIKANMEIGCVAKKNLYIFKYNFIFEYINLYSYHITLFRTTKKTPFRMVPFDLQQDDANGLKKPIIPIYCD